jgi:hypothetical protein
MQDRVKAPAIGMIVLGAVTLAFLLFSILARGMMLEMSRHALPPDRYADLEQQMMAGGMLVMLGRASVFCGSAFIIFAGLQMMKLQNHTMVVVAAILAMIPCFSSCCCVIGIPIGVWTLVVVLNREVKAAFTS